MAVNRKQEDKTQGGVTAEDVSNCFMWGKNRGFAVVRQIMTADVIFKAFVLFW
jgi:hypothetical protein